jgi:hypothetical protein
MSGLMVIPDDMLGLACVFLSCIFLCLSANLRRSLYDPDVTEYYVVTSEKVKKLLKETSKEEHESYQLDEGCKIDGNFNVGELQVPDVCEDAVESGDKPNASLVDGDSPDVIQDDSHIRLKFLQPQGGASGCQ